MWNVKEMIQMNLQKETHRLRKQTYGCQGKGTVRDFGNVISTAIFKMGNQQRPIVQHMELCSMLCASLGGKGLWWRLDTCVSMVESLPCLPETTTTLLIGYTPIQNVFGVKKIKIKKKVTLKNSLEYIKI